ncbi:MAG: ABC transporter ATP-binding protein [Lachnospiraceae bacterium]|nr:ABC transporter ATP-binding protein [Lachnospiraceae bacterium]MBP3296450.1 ABC transporter ATP-binding protein [Lachnospiraceae bacterium]MCR5127418.1 ABC transporter ATP-binding protein [Lachnospiraceae bacterium]
MVINSLSFEHVSGTSRKFALNDVSFALETGYIYAIEGPNGAGKTTLFQYILSEKQNYTGTICFEGTDIAGRHRELMNPIGFVSEENPFFNERSAIQNAEMLSAFYDDFDMELFKETLKEMGIAPTHTYGKMSRGEKIKMQLAFALAHGSRLLLMDEATAGLDPVFRRELFQRLRRRIAETEMTVLMSSHNEEEIRKNADYVALMQNGTLGGFHETITDG